MDWMRIHSHWRIDMRGLQKAIIGIATLALLLGACDVQLRNAFPATLKDVDEIRDNSSLTAQEKRTALVALGFSPTVINALLTDERTANQYGGDLRSAYDKVKGERFTELTPDEVQLYGDGAGDVDDGISFTLTDEQAQAIVDFFQNNSVAIRNELIAFLEDPIKAATISSKIPANALNDLFVDFDPDALLESLP